MQNAATLVGLLLIAPCCSIAQATNDADRAESSTVSPVEHTSAQSRPTPPDENDRVREYLKSLVDPFAMVTSGASAGIGQLRDKPTEWRQGAEGYGKRFESAFARHIAYSTMLFGASSLLHDDNRYFASSQTGFGPRFEYALESTVLARHYDSSGRAHRRLSVSRIGALAGAALVSRLWQPRSTGSLRSGAASFGISLGVAGGFNVAREFIPGFPK